MVINSVNRAYNNISPHSYYTVPLTIMEICLCLQHSDCFDKVFDCYIKEFIHHAQCHMHIPTKADIIAIIMM